MQTQALIEKLEATRGLSRMEWERLIAGYSPKDQAYAAERARMVSQARFGKKIYTRGLIEFSNYCKNNCYYCGIRRDNGQLSRYRLRTEEILSCCAEGYRLGFRTFVLQSGEDPYFSDARMEALVRSIHMAYPDCAITLSVGEKTREAYRRWFDAGADRYLLRHETASLAHYGQLHPPELSLKNRIRCLFDLREIGYQTGCGMMVGAPYQTPALLAEDMLFLTQIHPEMVGTGPFLPHHETPFHDQPAGSVELTLFLLSLVRLLLPNVLLPATTALGSAEKDGRARGVLAGANVVMPNLSPLQNRKKYLLYDHKLGTDDEGEESMSYLRAEMERIGYTLAQERGDYKEVLP